MFTRSISRLMERYGGKFLAIAMILVFAVASLPQGGASAQSRCQDTYTVQGGDYLIKIAAQYSGITYLDIAEANDIEAPYVISRGQRLCIPRRDGGGTSGGTGGTPISADIAVTKVGSDDIEVSVTDLQRNAAYFVKVDDRNDSGYEWFRVGVLRTDSDREGEERFDLPDELEDARSFNVCLKNTVTDDLICNDASLTRFTDEDGGDSGSGGSSGGSEDVSWRLRGGDLIVTVEGLSRNASYFVRVDDADESGYDWIRLGELETDDDREGEERFDLPSELEDTDDFNVCLKDTENDDLFCDDPSLNRFFDDDGGNGGSSSSDDASISITRLSAGRIVVNTTRFPRDSFWNVKVREWGEGASDWTVLGVLRTEDDRAGQYQYDLPDHLDQDSDNIYVCLKNLTNNDLVCDVSMGR
jgi:hypothetical protein